MLVLSRKQDEVIAIGDDIRITIVRCGPTRTIVGVDAPRELRVYRLETVNRASKPRQDRAR